MQRKKRFKKIYIEITNGCNLRCSFCASDSRPTRSMSVEAFESILHSISPYSNHIYLHVLGEPLLHPEILSLLSVADSYSIMVNLTSNGMLLDRLTATPEIYRPVRQINLSLHSMGGTAEPNLQKSYLISVLNRVRWIRDHTHTIISLRLWNISATEKEVSSYNTMACNLIRETFLIPESISLMADQKAGIKLADRIYLNWDHRFAWPGEGNNTTTVERAFCHGLRDQIAILVDGTVVPCCLDVQGEMALGNIFQDTMEVIMNSERTQQILVGFSEGRAVEKLCQKCTYRERF